jgi:hypothetical protein
MLNRKVGLIADECSEKVSAREALLEQSRPVAPEAPKTTLCVSAAAAA